MLAWKLYEWFVDKPVTSVSGEFDWRIFTTEMVGMVTVFGFVFASAVLKKLEGHFASVTIGWGLFLGATVASLVASAGVVNPAVAISLGFRPETVGYLGYLLYLIAGAVVGMNFYQMMFDKTGSSVAVRASSPAKKSSAKSVRLANDKTKVFNLKEAHTRASFIYLAYFRMDAVVMVFTWWEAVASDAFSYFL